MILLYILGTLLRILLISIVFLSLILFVYFKYTYKYWKRRNIPFIQTEFIFGSTKKLVTLQKSYGELLSEWYFKYKDLGHKYIGFFNFFEPVFIFLEPKMYKRILQTDFKHFTDHAVNYQQENDPLSQNIFVLKGEKWKKLRQKIVTAFTPAKVKNMFSYLLICSKELDHCLDKTIKELKPVNIKEISAFYTTDCICSCAFGIETNSFENQDTPVHKMGDMYLAPSNEDRIKLLVTYFFPKVSKILKLKHVNKNIESFFVNLVENTIKYREENNVTRNDFMQLLIDLKNDSNKLTLNEMIAQVFLFFMAGYETSSSTMSFCLFELAHNSEIQERTRREIMEVLERHGQLNYEAVMEMKYLERVIQGKLEK